MQIIQNFTTQHSYGYTIFVIFLFYLNIFHIANIFMYRCIILIMI